MSRVLILAQIIAEIAVSVFQDYGLGLAPLAELSQITALTAVRADTSTESWTTSRYRQSRRILYQ